MLETPSPTMIGSPDSEAYRLPLPAVNEKVRNGRLRTVEQLQLCSGVKDPAIGELAARPQLNSIGSWMDDFVDTNNWKGVNHILLMLDRMEVSKVNLFLKRM